MRGFEFAELKAFAAVVERKSFARAAEHLGVSPSALSQTIRQLEGRIGTRLLNRTTRSVAPSVGGELLYGRIAPLFREMDAAVAEASEAAGQITGTLRINTLGIAARTIIAPRLSRFHQAYPDVLLDIVVDDALTDIVVGRFDAGIRVGGRIEKDMIAVRLTPDLKMGCGGISRLSRGSRYSQNTCGFAWPRMHQLAASDGRQAISLGIREEGAKNRSRSGWAGGYQSR